MNVNEEEQRVVIVAAILATILGFITVFNQPFLAPIELVLGISGTFLFAYLVLTAANLKYKNKGDLAAIVDTGRIRPYLFDVGISIYGLALFGGLFIPLLNNQQTNQIIKGLINVDTIWGWIALLLAAAIWAVTYILAQILVRIWAMFKFKKWFWRTKTVREYFKKEEEKLSIEKTEEN